MQTSSLAIGCTVVFGLLYWAQSNKAHRWRRFAMAYRAWEKPDALATSRMQTILLFGDGLLYTGYTGIVTVTVAPSGLGLRLMPPFSWLHKPLFIPFADLKVEQTDWYLNSASFELRASKLPKMKIVMAGDLLDWIASHAENWKVDTRRRW